MQNGRVECEVCHDVVTAGHSFPARLLSNERVIALLISRREYTVLH